MESALTQGQRTPRSTSAAGFGEQTINSTEFVFFKEPDKSRLANGYGPFWLVIGSEAQHRAQWMPMVNIRWPFSTLVLIFDGWEWCIGELGEKK
jgi:hypothetical protein